MALLDIELAENKGTTLALQNRIRVFDASNTLLTATNPYGGGAYRISSAGAGPFLNISDTATKPARVIFGGMLDLFSSSPGYMLYIWGNGTVHCTLYNNYGGTFQLRRGTTVDLPCTTFASVQVRKSVRWQRWMFIELDVEIANSATVTLYVNGVQMQQWTGVDTNNGATTPWIDVVQPTGTSNQPLWSRMYVIDTTGTVNNARLGPCNGEALAPNADGGVSNFTPLSGLTNYEMVDETGDPDDATSYVSSSTVDHTDRYGYPNVDTDYDTIKGVQVVSDHRKTGAGQRRCRHVCQSGLTGSESADFGVPIDWGLDRSMFEVDPNTSALWTTTNLNSAEFGFTIES